MEELRYCTLKIDSNFQLLKSLLRPLIGNLNEELPTTKKNVISCNNTN